MATPEELKKKLPPKTPTVPNPVQQTAKTAPKQPQQQVQAAQKQPVKAPASPQVAPKWTEGTSDWTKVYKDRASFLAANKGYMFPSEDTSLFSDIPIKTSDKDAVIAGIHVPANKLPADYQKQLDYINGSNSTIQNLVDNVGMRSDQSYAYQINKYADQLNNAINERIKAGDPFGAAKYATKLEAIKKQFPQYARTMYNRAYEKGYGDIANNHLKGAVGMTADEIKQTIGIHEDDEMWANINSLGNRAGTFIAGVASNAIPGSWMAYPAMSMANNADMLMLNEALDNARLRGDKAAIDRLEHKLRDSQNRNTAIGTAMWGNVGGMIGGKVLGVGVTAATNATAAAATQAASKGIISKTLGAVRHPIQTAKGVWHNVAAHPVKSTVKAVSAGGGVVSMGFGGYDSGYSKIAPFYLRAFGNEQQKEGVKYFYAGGDAKQYDNAFKTAISEGKAQEFYDSIDNDFVASYDALQKQHNGNIPEDEVTKLVSSKYFLKGHVTPSFFQTDIWTNATPKQHMQWLKDLAATRAMASFNLGTKNGDPTAAALRGIGDKMANPAAFMNEIWDKDKTFAYHMSTAIQNLPFQSLLAMKKEGAKDGGAGLALFTRTVADSPEYAERLALEGIDYYSKNKDALADLANDKSSMQVFTQLMSHINSEKDGIYKFIDRMKDPTAVFHKASILITAMEKQGITLPPALSGMKDKAGDIAHYIFKKDPFKAMPIFASLWFRKMGHDGIADILQNPAAFYLTAIVPSS